MNNSTKEIFEILKLWKGGCGDRTCGRSSGICGSLTFGKGELDSYGYWEFPCFRCARDYKEANPDVDVVPNFEVVRES